MKFLLPIALLAVAGVSAQDPKCRANYIVDRCLSTEKPKVVACSSNDLDCLCAAYEAVATCYNNCPDDTRSAPAQQEVSVYCAQASLYNTKTTITQTWTSTSTSSESISIATATTTDGSSASNTVAFTADQPTNTGGAGELVINAGGVMLAFAGVMGAVL